jgi:hypothetical protein
MASNQASSAQMERILNKPCEDSKQAAFRLLIEQIRVLSTVLAVYEGLPSKEGASVMDQPQGAAVEQDDNSKKRSSESISSEKELKEEEEDSSSSDMKRLRREPGKDYEFPGPVPPVSFGNSRQEPVNCNNKFCSPTSHNAFCSSSFCTSAPLLGVPHFVSGAGEKTAERKIIMKARRKQ